MTGPSEVRYETTGDGVAILRLDAPERRHALTGSMAREIAAALRRTAADVSVGALVIIGTEDGFCAGAKRELLDGVAEGQPDALADIEDVYRIFDEIRALPCAVIAAVQGAAVGAGLNIALAADVRVVAEDAYLRSMFVANGIHPGGAHLKMLLGIAGPELATLMAVLDEPLSGAEFARLGGAAFVAPVGEVLDRALTLARRAAAQPALARRIKRSIGDTAALPPAVASRIEGERQARTLAEKRSTGAAAR